MAYDIDRTMSTAMDRFLSPFDGFLPFLLGWSTGGAPIWRIPR
ncbi:hypothetical protein [Actinotignum sanguinis]|nr:hypothetical protein [Actinotignum sanguinis]MDY5136229.1 hypothetical protein [Actinotignum sanguinis]